MDESPNFSEISIVDLSSFSRALDEALSLFGNRYPLWRGHGDQQWALRAEVWRLSGEGLRYDELTLVRSFMNQAESRHERCPSRDAPR